MSRRAEGCGLWLSTKDKRSTQLPLQKSGKAKKSKQKFLMSASRRSSGLDIRVSSSPLSPRSRKKFKNAKQTKINKYFGSDSRSNDFRRSKILESVSEPAGCFEGKLAKISVKRHRKENISDTGYLTEAPFNQEKEKESFKDLNVNGISHLDYSFEDFEECIETNSLKESVLVEDSDFVNSPFSPSRKSCRTLNIGDNWPQCSPTKESQSIPTECEMSPSFHFSQWERDQIAKCQEIQDESCDENTGSPFTAASCLDFSQWKKDQMVKCQEIQDESCDENTGSPFTATSCLDFSQWKKDQIAKCRKIQNEKFVEYSLCRNTGCDNFPQWKRDEKAKCKETHDENVTENSLCKGGSGVAIFEEQESLTLNHINGASEFSETPPFQFTQWANQQVQICREIQKGVEDSALKRLYQSYLQKNQLRSRVGCSEEISERESGLRGLLLEWAKTHERTSGDDACEEIHVKSGSNDSDFWESEGWDKWTVSKRETGSVTNSSYSDGSEFLFSDWVKSQIRKCTAIQEENTEAV